MGSMRKRIPHKIIDGAEAKYCKPCDIWHGLSEFNKKKASYDGLETKCKACAKKKSERFRRENPSYDREYQVKNADRLKIYKRDYYQKKRAQVNEI